MVVLLGVLVLNRNTKPPRMKALLNVRTICLACRQYSREHGGVFPASLDVIFPRYLQDRTVLASPLQPGDPNGYTYTPPPAKLTDSPDTIVLEDRFAPTIDHTRIVSYANGSARVLTPPPQ